MAAKYRSRFERLVNRGRPERQVVEPKINLDQVEIEDTMMVLQTLGGDTGIGCAQI
jgi:hypothetical protein